MPGSNYVSFCSFVPPRAAIATLIPTTGTTADNNTTGTRREVLDRSVVRVVAADTPDPSCCRLSGTTFSLCPSWGRL